MTNDKDSAVLEPCPFCGGEAAIGTGRNYYFVLCPDCLTSTNVVLAESIMPTEAEAIAAWNTRQPTQSDVLKAAGDAIRGLLDIASDDNLDSAQAGRAYAALHDIDTALKKQSK